MNPKKRIEFGRLLQAGAILLIIMGLLLAQGNIFNFKVLLGIVIGTLGIIYWVFQDTLGLYK